MFTDIKNLQKRRHKFEVIFTPVILKLRVKSKDETQKTQGGEGMNLDKLVKRVYVAVLRGSYREAMDLVFKNNHLMLNFDQVWDLKRLIEEEIIKGIATHDKLTVDDIPIYYDHLMLLRTMVTVFDRYEYVLNYSYDLNNYLTYRDILVLEDETELLFSVIKDKYKMTDTQEEHVRNQLHVTLAELKITESDWDVK